MDNRRVIEELPPERQAADPYRWVEAAKAAQQLHKENPTAWIEAAKHVPVVKIAALRLRRTPPFMTTEGQIEVTYRHSKVEDDGVRYADCYVRWVPTQENK